MLHILTRSPWKCDIDMMIHMLRDNDDLLLLQNGVLAAIDNSHFIKMLKNTYTISALMEDLEARGLINQISSDVNIITYKDFVSLTIKHNSHMNW